MLSRLPGGAGDRHAQGMAVGLLLPLMLIACAPLPPCPPAPSAPAVATDPSAPKTREQVRAEVMAAREQGTLEDFNGMITVAREWPGSGGNAMPTCR